MVMLALSQGTRQVCFLIDRGRNGDTSQPRIPTGAGLGISPLGLQRQMF